jgi:predicted metal-dependent HD superfamily phosphohydrolase
LKIFSPARGRTRPEPARAIAEVKEAVRRAGGWVAEKEHGAGVHEALRHFLCREGR